MAASQEKHIKCDCRTDRYRDGQTKTEESEQYVPICFTWSQNFFLEEAADNKFIIC